jgi:uncharacterized protein (DUF952 family)
MGRRGAAIGAGADRAPAKGTLAPIYHLALRPDWDEAVARGQYTRSTVGKSLADEGFIHCSFASQVESIARLLYRGRDEVLLLVIDTSRVPDPVQVERVDDSEEAFPHLYGPLPLDAVIRVAPVPLDAIGELRLDGLIGT